METLENKLDRACVLLESLIRNPYAVQRYEESLEINPKRIEDKWNRYQHIHTTHHSI